MNASAELALLRFWQLALLLKQVRRQGWIDRGVAHPESSADHSWGVALLGWMMARDRPELDRNRVLLLGLIHDLPEAVAGDATPFDTLRDATGTIDPAHFQTPPAYSEDARQVKHAAERAALVAMVEGIEESLRFEITEAWNDYEAQLTPEAIFVRQIDKLETLLQATQYAAAQPGLAIDSFRLGAIRDVTDPDLVRLIEALAPQSGDVH